MPELPEVETLCRQLGEIISGKEIQSCSVLDGRLGFAEDLTGLRIHAIRRQGKGLEIHLDTGQKLRLHLRMTGRLHWQPHSGDPPPYSRFRIFFNDGILTCIDPRRFATLSLQQSLPFVQGPTDPLQGLDPLHLSDLARSRHITVKAFLMDQRVIAGIGNIYVCEILFAARVSPLRKARDLSNLEWRRIAKAADVILRKAVRCRGTSVSDWRDLFGKPGTYQHHLNVYRRAGQSCVRCEGSIERLCVGGRGTYFCPDCQH